MENIPEIDSPNHSNTEIIRKTTGKITEHKGKSTSLYLLKHSLEPRQWKYNWKEFYSYRKWLWELYCQKKNCRISPAKQKIPSLNEQERSSELKIYNKSVSF